MQLYDSVPVTTGQTVLVFVLGFFVFWSTLVRTAPHRQPGDPFLFRPLIGRDSYPTLCRDATIALVFWLGCGIALSMTMPAWPAPTTQRNFDFMAGIVLSYVRVLLAHRNAP